MVAQWEAVLVLKEAEAYSAYADHQSGMYVSNARLFLLHRRLMKIPKFLLIVCSVS